MLVVLCFPAAVALENGVGRVPALGWSTWNYFVNDVSFAPSMHLLCLSACSRSIVASPLHLAVPLLVSSSGPTSGW